VKGRAGKAAILTLDDNGIDGAAEGCGVDRVPALGHAAGDGSHVIHDVLIAGSAALAHGGCRLEGDVQASVGEGTSDAEYLKMGWRAKCFGVFAVFFSLYYHSHVKRFCTWSDRGAEKELPAYELGKEGMSDDEALECA
jgi:hypothetical protein